MRRPWTPTSPGGIDAIQLPERTETESGGIDAIQLPVQTETESGGIDAIQLPGEVLLGYSYAPTRNIPHSYPQMCWSFVVFAFSPRSG